MVNIDISRSQVTTLKLHSDTDSGLLRVSNYGQGFIKVSEQRLHNTFLLTPENIHQNPGIVSICELKPGSLPVLAEENIEILLLGTGRVQQIPPLAFIADLSSRRIGLEYMDTHAACRTI